MFFDWKEGLAKDQGITDVLAAYVPEEALHYSKTGGLIPALGKAFAVIGSFLYSKTQSSEKTISIRPNEAAFVLRQSGFYPPDSDSSYFHHRSPGTPHESQGSSGS